MIVFSVLLIISSWSQLVLAAQSKRPPLADPELFCDGCFALMSELAGDMAASMGSLGLAARIEAALSGVCHTDRLRAYKFSPPTQVREVYCYSRLVCLFISILVHTYILCIV